MSKIIVMRGLPASGKSTRAKKMLDDGNTVRLNKDLLRTMLHADKWTPQNEALTMKAEKVLALELLNEGVRIVVDDTNLGEKHRQSWVGLAEYAGAKIEYVDLRKVPVQECIKRDRERTDKEPIGKP